MGLAGLDTDPPERGPASRRVLLPTLIAASVWLASYVVHEWYLASMHGIVSPVGRSAIEGPFDWIQIPSVLLPPDLGWIVFPVLLLCLRQCRAQRALPVERVLVASAPVIALLLVSWYGYSTLGTDFLPVPGTLRKAATEAWSWVFVARDAVSLVCTGATALFLESLASGDLWRRASELHRGRRRGR